VTNYAQRDPQGYNADYVGRSRQLGQRIDPRRPGAAPIDVEQSNNSSTKKQTKAIDPDALVAEERAALAAKINATKASNCEIGKKISLNYKHSTESVFKMRKALLEF